VPDDPSSDDSTPTDDLRANVELSAEFVADRIEAGAEQVAGDVNEVGTRVIKILYDDFTSRDGYLIVLIMIIVTIIVIPIGDGFIWGQVLNATALALLVLTTLSRSHVSPHLRVAGAIVTIGAIVFAIAGAIQGHHLAASGSSQPQPLWLYAVGAGSYTIVLAMCFPAILRQAFRHRRIDLNTVAAALSAYLLLGLIFTAAYRFIDVLQPPFFVQGSVNSFTYVYFSYVTLTTIGYGDFTAAHDAGRAIAILEGLFGQVFLVTIVAVVVSNLGRERNDVPEQAPVERRPMIRRRSGRQGQE
jgi:hypothetical protein